MGRPFVYLCRVCHTSHRDSPGETTCLACVADAVEARKLYTRIVLQYPSLRRLTLPQLFERMYESAKKKR